MKVTSTLLVTHHHVQLVKGQFDYKTLLFLLRHGGKFILVIDDLQIIGRNPLVANQFTTVIACSF